MKVKNEVINILEQCTVENDTVYLPNIQLERKLYQDTNKVLESIGGKWNRKAKGHVFDEDPTDSLEEILLTSEYSDQKKEFQFFPTPENLAWQLVEFAEVKPDDVLLEPSAGQGAIVDEFPKENTAIIFELNDKNVQVLREKGYEVVKTDFLTENGFVVDKIIMNPPFSRQQDISHILHAYSLLGEGGILVSIVSESPFFRDNKKSMEFRQFLEDNDAEIIKLPEGSFKESGTMVNTRIIKIKKTS